VELTFPSLSKLKFSAKKPILICDADEVIFNFMHHFELFLKNKKLFFNWKSYALAGNILKEDNTPLNEVEVKTLINDFFKFNSLNMELINGAKESLQKIAEYFNIVILSNIPFEFYELRKKALIKNNLDYPFFANKGEKGTPCSNIFKVHKQQTWFIDDSPYQILAVKKKTPKIKTILFIDNSKLAKLLQNKDNCDFYSTNWHKNRKILLNQFMIYD